MTDPPAAVSAAAGTEHVVVATGSRPDADASQFGSPLQAECVQYSAQGPSNALTVRCSRDWLTAARSQRRDGGRVRPQMGWLLGQQR